MFVNEARSARFGATATSGRAAIARSRSGVALGVSIVEMLVGITIGLFILAAASMVATSQLAGNRRAMVQMQMQQDLRVIADMMTAALRRSGYHNGFRTRSTPPSPPASYGTVYDVVETGALGTANCDAGIRVASSADQLFAGAGPYGENDRVDGHDEAKFCWKQADKVLQTWLRDGAGWQTLSDPQLMSIVNVVIDVTERQVPMPCGSECEVSSSGCPWQLKTREFRFRIDAEAAGDPRIRRSVEEVVRSPNALMWSAPGAPC